MIVQNTKGALSVASVAPPVRTRETLFSGKLSDSRFGKDDGARGTSLGDRANIMRAGAIVTLVSEKTPPLDGIWTRAGEGSEFSRDVEGCLQKGEGGRPRLGHPPFLQT
jgi:hypothetical protein